MVYIENEIFDSIDNELILNRFQNMDSRRNQLSRSTKHSVACLYFFLSFKFKLLLI